MKTVTLNSIRHGIHGSFTTIMVLEEHLSRTNNKIRVGCSYLGYIPPTHSRCWLVTTMDDTISLGSEIYELNLHYLHF